MKKLKFLKTPAAPKLPKAKALQVPKAPKSEFKVPKSPKAKQGGSLVAMLLKQKLSRKTPDFSKAFGKKK